MALLLCPPASMDGAWAASRIFIPGDTVQVDSTLPFTESSGTTLHALALPSPPPADGTVTVEVLGGFELLGPEVFAEGTSLGRVLGASLCLPQARSWPLSALLLDQLAQDGTVEISVVNPLGTTTPCSENRHSVELTYREFLTSLDLGQVGVGETAGLMLGVVNLGTSTLEVTGIATDNPAFTVSASAASVAPGAAATLTVEFAPAAPGPDTAVLGLSTNDPSRPVIAIDLLGEGLDVPVIQLQPLSFHLVVPQGLTETVEVLITNAGSGDLQYSLSEAGLDGFTPIPDMDFQPISGSVPSGATETIQVRVDARTTAEGSYGSQIAVTSNDPVAPMLRIPVELEVPLRPIIDAWGDTVRVRSLQDFGATPDGRTYHSFQLPESPDDGATLSLQARGDLDYGYPDGAAVVVEGTDLGSVSGWTGPCQLKTRDFTIYGHELPVYAADGRIEVEVANSPSFGPGLCPFNEHALTLSYQASASGISYPPVIEGDTATRSLHFKNLGKGTLMITGITSATPEFTASATTLAMGHWQEAVLDVTFAPSAAGTFTGSLLLDTNDPLVPSLTVQLAGDALPAPAARVEPGALHADLGTGESQERTITIHNDGDSPLAWSISSRTVSTAGTGAAPGVEILREPPGGFGCFTADRARGLIYAHGHLSTAFYRYDAAVDAWEPLADAPEEASSAGCGTARLGSRIYSRLGPGRSEIAVYEIATDTWSLAPHPVAAITGAVMVSDDVASIYLGLEDTAVRWEPDAGIVELMPAPPVTLGARKGSLTYSDGSLLGLNGLGGFAVLAPGASDWMEPPPPPQAASFGASSAATGEFFAEAPRAQRALLVLDPDSGSWSEIPVPLGDDLDYGLVDLAGPAPGIYGVGKWGARLAFRLPRPPGGYALPSASHGEVPPHASADVSVRLSSGRLAEGLHESELMVSTNDPVAPDWPVAITIAVAGRPALLLEADPIGIESVREYAADRPQTFHRWAVGVPPSRRGRIEATVEGLPLEHRLALPGLQLPPFEDTLAGCAPFSASYELTASDLASISETGVIKASVTGSASLSECDLRTHTVRLTWERDPTDLEFGIVEIGQSRSQSIRLRNDGTRVLSISAISVDRPGFAPSLQAAAIPPAGSLDLEISFAPLSAGRHDAVMTITSDDPAAPGIPVQLGGEGREPLLIATEPPAIALELLEGRSATVPLLIRNDGASDAALEIAVRPADPLTGEIPDSWDGSELLPLPPRVTQCVAADTVRQAIYAYNGLWQRYSAASERWESLANPPVGGVLGCSAAVLGDRVYLSRWNATPELESYDIPTDTWTALPLPVLGDAGILASDGFRWLYAIWDRDFLRIDPVTGTHEVLATPPFGFAARGMQFHKGELYAHSEDGFFVYSPRTDWWKWLPGPPPPGPPGWPPRAGLGAAMDALGGIYHTWGPSQLPVSYAFEIDSGTWSVMGIPTESASAPGMAWLPGPSPALYLLSADDPSLTDRDFFRLDTEPAFLTVHRPALTVPAGGTRTVNVNADTRRLGPGVYALNLEVRRTAGPGLLAERAAAVPVELTVLPAPRLDVRAQIEAASVADWAGDQAVTRHVLRLPNPPDGPGLLDLRGAGPYAGAWQMRVEAEGSLIGHSIEAPPPCSQPAREDFDLASDLLSGLLSDGVAEVTVENSPETRDTCEETWHEVTLRYEMSVDDLLDLGELILGGRPDRTVPLTLSNPGSLPLTIHSIEAAGPEYMIPDAGLVLQPGESHSAELLFAPSGLGAFPSSLVIRTDLPDAPDRVIPLSGSAVPPPALAVAPAGLVATLVPGDSTYRTITLANSGDWELRWSADLIDHFEGGSYWMEVSPQAGTVPPGGSSDVTVTFRSDALPDGIRHGRVAIRSDDPALPRSEHPVVLGIGEITPDWIAMEPEILSRRGGARFVTVRLQLPSGADPRDVVPSSVTIDGAVGALTRRIRFADSDGDTVDEIALRFSRRELLRLVPPTGAINVTIRGEVRGTAWFTGSLEIRTGGRGGRRLP